MDSSSGTGGWRQSRWSTLLIAVPLLFLLVFFFVPLANILRLGISTTAVADLLGRNFVRVLWFTLWQALLSTLLTLVFGLPAAFLFARYRFRGKELLRALTAVPFVMPTVVVAAAFRALLGPNGPLNEAAQLLLGLEAPLIRLEQSISLILLAHIFYNITVVIRLVGGFWANLNPRLNDAALMLGASPRRVFREITLPLLRPAIGSAALLVFLFTFTSFGVILILGGPAFSTLETEIFRQYVIFLRPDIAAGLSLWQIAFTFVLMSLYARRQQATAVPLDFRARKTTLRQAKTRQEKLFVGGLMLALTFFIILPLFALVWRSLIDRDGQFTTAYYAALPVLRRGSITFIPPLAAVGNSLGYAGLTVVLATLLGLPAASWLARPSRWQEWLDPLLMLPLGASAVTLGLGYVVTFDQLRTSPVLVLIAHTLVALPFVVRSLLPVLQGIRPSLREAAAILGASPWRVWREVELPIVGRALLVAAVFAFTISLGEFGATSFIVRPNSGFLTLPVAIERYLSQPGALNFGQAMAMSSILMGVCTAGFIAIERFRYADVGAF